MNYKIKKHSEFENLIDININFEDLEDKKNEAIKKISKSLKVKGFRPGKIPKNIVIREVGEEYITEEALDLHLPESIFEVLKKEEINPATRPVVKEVKKEKKSFKVALKFPSVGSNDLIVVADLPNFSQ
jgi:trigger factor